MDFKEQIKFDLGLCTDTLIAIFVSNNINKTLGLIWFVMGLVTPVISFIFKKNTIKNHKNYFK